MASPKRPRAFQLPEQPQEHIAVDRRAMNEIKDIAHKLYLANKCPNGNLIMFQALKEYIERKGAKANFTVIMET